LFDEASRVPAIEAWRDRGRCRRLGSHDLKVSDAFVVSTPDAVSDGSRTLRASTGASVATGEPSFLITPQSHSTTPRASLCLIKYSVEHAVT
jgi:hypothetical protein